MQTIKNRPFPREPSDIGRLCDGDHETWDAFYMSGWFYEIYSRAFRKTGNAQDADELAHDVFKALYDSIAGKKASDIRDFGMYAWKIIHRSLRKKHRMSICGRRFEELEEQIAAENVSEIMPGDRNYIRAMIWDIAAEMLSGEENNVVKLCFRERLKNCQIAEVLGISRDKVSHLKYNAVKKLRKNKKLQELWRQFFDLRYDAGKNDDGT